MKLRTIFILVLIHSNSSCAFFNSKTVDVAISSNPSGADLFIEGRNYGKTPVSLNIEPKPYNVVLTKEGYGSTRLNMEVWGTIRTDINGSVTADGTRCLLDMLSVFFSFNAWNFTRCGDFKEKQYNVTIPRTVAKFGSTIGIGQRPSDMIPYYYSQDMGNSN